MTTPEHRAPEGGRPVSEMQERIAWALHGRNGVGFWLAQTDAERDRYLRDALAAMKAMREPTRPMVDAGSDFIEFAEAWRAAIDREISIAEGGKDGE